MMTEAFKNSDFTERASDHIQVPFITTKGFAGLPAKPQLVEKSSKRWDFSR